MKKVSCLLLLLFAFCSWGADLGAKINTDMAADYCNVGPYSASYGAIATTIVPRKGCVITFNPGVFSVNASLGSVFDIQSGKDNVTIRGAGSGATVIAFAPASYTSASPFLKVQADGFALEGVNLSPSAVGLSTATNYLIDIRGTKFGRIEDVQATGPGLALFSDSKGSTPMSGWVFRDVGVANTCRGCGTCQFNSAVALGVNAAAPGSSQLSNVFDSVFVDARGLQGDGTASQSGPQFYIAGAIAPILLTHSGGVGEPMAMQPAVKIEASAGGYIPYSIHSGQGYFESGFTTNSSYSDACWTVNEGSGLTLVNNYCASSKYGMLINGGRKITVAAGIFLQLFNGAMTNSADALIVSGNDFVNFSDGSQSITTGYSAIKPAAGASRFQIVNNRCNPHFNGPNSGWDSSLTTPGHQGKYCVEIPAGASNYYVVSGNLAHHANDASPETAGGCSDGGTGLNKVVYGNQR